MTSPELSTRALNRALLDRQMLLDRVDLPIPAAVERMSGIQAQYAPAAYVGLWSRLRDFDRPALTSELEQRTVVQATTIRATIHVVSAADYWPTTVAVRRTRRDWFERATHRQLAGIDMEGVAEVVRAVLADGPMAMRDLAARVEEAGFPRRAAAWAGMRVDLVRVPPSGTWERRRADRYALADQWLPPPADLDEPTGVELLVRRYLGGFGPAPVADIAAWAGLPVGILRPILARMELRSFRSADRTALVDLPRATLPDPDTPAPPRFLAVWDAMLLVHARRTNVLPEALRSRVFSTNTPHSVNTFLLDGRVAGAWRVERGEIDLVPFRPLSRTERASLEEEAHRLTAFHA